MKAIVITGASTGIGLDAALFLEKQGFHIFAGVRQEEDAARLRSLASSSNITPLFIDITQAESIAQALEQVRQAVGKDGLAGLINNAGIAVSAPLEFIDLDDFRWQLEVNITGHLAVTQAFLPLLRQARGRIINISSVSGTITYPFMGPYATSKQGLEAVTDALRQELKPWGIEVISIQPGSVKTPIWDKSAEKTRERYEKFPAQATELYGDALRAMQKRMQHTADNGLPVEVISQTIYEALTAQKPKTRYFVVRNGWKTKLANLLPDRLRDRLVAKNIGLPKSYQ